MIVDSPEPGAGDAGMGEQSPGSPGVLAAARARHREFVDGARSEITEVPDGRRDEDECAGHRFTSIADTGFDTPASQRARLRLDHVAGATAPPADPPGRHRRNRQHHHVGVDVGDIDRELHPEGVDGPGGGEQQRAFDPVAAEQAAPASGARVGDLERGDHSILGNEPRHGGNLDAPAARRSASAETDGRIQTDAVSRCSGAFLAARGDAGTDLADTVDVLDQSLA